MNSAPATARAGDELSATSTSIVTTSPGLASTCGITHETSPSTSLLTVIEPSTNETLVSSLPFVSLMKVSAHVTGYTPGAQFAGTVNSNEATTAPSLDSVPSPDLTAKPNSLIASFGTIVAPYASEPLTDEYLIGDLASNLN